MPLLEHVKELISKLDEMGIKPSPTEEAGGEGDEDEWESDDGSLDGDGDVEMQ